MMTIFILLLTMQTLSFITITIGLYILILITINIKKSRSSKGPLRIVFFHPFCNDGGGGEKVLWSIVKALLYQNTNEHTKYTIGIYSLEANTEKMLQKVKIRFNIDISHQNQNLKIIVVSGRWYLMPKRFLTMLLHIVLPCIYAFKCIWQYQPDIFYDTTGFAFNFLMVKLFLPTTKCFAYVHYPFISYDMIHKIQERRIDFNNQSQISKSLLLTKMKIIYYRLILVGYKLVGLLVTFSQTNSTWTHNHMKTIWSEQKLVKLYPPCTVDNLIRLPKNESHNIVMMSLAQFRPQKNQILQVEVLAELIKRLQSYSMQNKPRLILRICGTTRSQQDQIILNAVRKKADQLKLTNTNIEFRANMDYQHVIQSLQQAHIGIHTMEAEHFGISIVEMLAAGMIVVAHDSAGPKQDIIKDNNYLAFDKESYIEKIWRIIVLNPNQRGNLSNEMRAKAMGFSQQKFMERFVQIFQKAINNIKYQ